MSVLLNSQGIVIPKITTDEIVIGGKPLSEAISGSDLKITSPHALGDFYFSITSYMPEGVLPLNGSEASRVTYSDLYNYVLNIHNELVTSGKKFIVSEEEWQNISMENNGYVPYYSYGTGDGLFRLPRMSGYLKATGEVDEAGNYVAEGLPNITGSFTARPHQNGDLNYGGALYTDDVSGAFSITIQGGVAYANGASESSRQSITDKMSFDASDSNSIYGNSEHVTPETNTLFVGVWALSAFTQVGTANLNEIKEIIKDCEAILGDSLPLLSSRYDNKGLETSAWKLSDGRWFDGRIYTDAYNKILQRFSEGDSTCLEMKESELLSSNEFPENFLIDTENQKFRLPLYNLNQRTLIKEWRNEAEWYRIYNDGYIEQGGKREGINADAYTTINFYYPFKDTNYTFIESTICDDVSTYTASEACIYSQTVSSVKIAQDTQKDLGGIWYVFGYIDPNFMPPHEEWEIDYNYYFKVSHGVEEGKINIEEKLVEFEESAYTRLDEIVEEISKDYVVHVDKQVGELYFSFNDFYPDGVIPLDGRLVSRATYADLWQWVQEKGLVKDDTLITTNDENTVSIFNEDGSIRYCQWYGSGDGSLTFRMPKINGYLGATGDNTLAGQYITEGLPNITGSLTGMFNYPAIFTANDAFVQSEAGINKKDATAPGSYWSENGDINFSANDSNPIYGNSEHVTPETNTLFVGVWAITASKAAVFDFGETAELLKQSESYLMNNVPLMSSRWDRDGLGNLGWVKADGSWVDGKTYTGAYNYCVEKLVSGHTDFIAGHFATITEDNCSKFIVDRINKRFRLPISNGQRQLVAAYKEGTQWYNIYSDGWIEQGGEYYNNSIATATIDFLVPFKDTTYIVDKITGVDGEYGNNAYADKFSTWDYTTSSFKTKVYNTTGLNRFRWFAAGYGEILNVSSPERTSHLYFKLAHEFYAPTQAVIQEKLDLIDNLATKVDINLPTLSSRWDSDFAENIGWVKSEGQWLNGNVYRDAYDLMVSRIGVHDKFIEATEGTELTDENADKFLIDTTAVKFRLPLVNGERTLVSTYKEDKNWYNLYSDGWLEQGGYLSCPSEPTTLTLFKPYKAVDYTVTTTGSRTSANTGNIVITSRTVDSISFYIGDDSTFNAGDLHWRSIGFSKIPTLNEFNKGNYLYFKLADTVPSTVVNTQQIIDDLKQECDDFKEELQNKFNSGAFVETFWKSEDGKNWYRLWSDGWIEQGGTLEANDSSKQLTFLIPFTNINWSYFVTGAFYTTSTGSPCVAILTNSKTITGATLQLRWNGTAGNINSYMPSCTWYACGY